MDVRAALKGLLVAIVKREWKGGDAGELAGVSSVTQAQQALAQAVGKTRMTAALMGALDLAREVNEAHPNKVRIPQKFQEADPVSVTMGTFGDLPFTEAIQAFQRRFPVLKHVATTLAPQFTPQRLFWLSRSADESITRRVKKALGDTLETGETFESFERAVRRIERSAANWTSSYLELVFRNNIASAYSEGRKEQANSPDLKGWALGWMYMAVDDGDVRKNHLAANGLVWAIDDGATEALVKTPRGHRCRCSWRMLTRPEAEQLGIVEDLRMHRVLRVRGGRVTRLRGVPQSARPLPEEMAFSTGGR